MGATSGQISWTAFVLLGIALSALPSHGRKFDKCSLVKELQNNGIPHFDLPDWVCLTEKESSYNTKALNKHNTDGSYDWGLFQINDRFWCKPSDGRPSANMCRVPCDKLMSDDIRAAVNCAKTIKSQQGLAAWVAWKNFCQGNKPSIGECFHG